MSALSFSFTISGSSNMLANILENPISNNLLETGFVFIILSIVYFCLRFFFSRKLTSTKSKKRLRARLVYIFIVIFLVLIARIWITGFTHFFYALSLVSAGLVVTNKETIMNFVGWGVITWRGLFLEGDYIQIGDNAGFVYELGVLYFKLLQGSEQFSNTSSGKMVKIPNGQVITQAIVNFSLNHDLIETTQTWYITPESDVKLAMNMLQKQSKIIIDEFYQDNQHYSLHHYKGPFAKRLNLDVNTKLELKLEKPEAFKITLVYYCFPRDRDTLDKHLLLSLYRLLKQQDDVKVAFSN